MATEDLTTFTEVDPNNKFTVTSSRVTWASLHQGESAYVYFDFGVDYFDGSLEVVFTVKFTGIFDPGGTGINFVCVFANIVDDWQGLDDANESALAVMVGHYSSGEWFLAAYELDSGAVYQATSIELTVNTLYYVRMVRDESVGTYGTLYIYIYDDAAMTNLIQTKSIALHTSMKDYRYFYAVQSRNAGDSAQANETDGYVENITLNNSILPVVTQDTPVNIGATTATGKGNIVSQGGSAVTEHGHCWSTSANPTTADSKTENGAGLLGAFTSAITGLVTNTLYHIRAYATNAFGTSYGDDMEFSTHLPQLGNPNIDQRIYRHVERMR